MTSRELGKQLERYQEFIETSDNWHAKAGHKASITRLVHNNLDIIIDALKCVDPTSETGENIL